MRIMTRTSAYIFRSPSDITRGGGSEPVAEIVTFQLAKGADVTEVAPAAAGMTPFLTATGSCLSRTLSVDESGLWTDHIIWTSMQAAKEAAAAIVQSPEARPFMALIDPETVVMRHAPVALRSEGHAPD